MHTLVQPEGWARPIGYANGVVARGRTVFIGGQLGWTAQHQFDTDDFVGQVRQALENIVCVLGAAHARPEHITSMTWYFVDKREYLANRKAIGEVYRSIIGRTFPAMAALQVVALVEDRAKVEIQAIAVVPD
jgi:enamine deaminase RidA (YjgF/YER057c/UK114 family)